jgi:hypothetical protein
MSSILFKNKKRMIQMYAGEPPREIWGGADVLNTNDALIDFYKSLIKKEQNNGVELHNLLVQEQNKVKQLENDKTQLTNDLSNLNKDINTILTI